MALQEKKTENVLIVDDVVANLVVLTDMIKKAGYLARPVTSVKQAMDAIEAKLPDLILLDITMPEIDGFEYCAMLKKNVKTRDIPVIFISAMASPETKEKALCFTFLQMFIIQKTIDEKKILQRLEANSKKPMKKSKWQQRIEALEKQNQAILEEREKETTTKKKITVK